MPLSFLLTALAVLQGTTKEPSRYPCESRTLSYSLAPEQSVAAFTEGVFGSEEYSGAALTYHNLTSKPVVAITLVAEFRLNGGQDYITIPFQAALMQQQPPADTLIYSSHVERLQNPVPPGGIAHLLSRSPTTTGACATEVKITFLTVVFSDGSRFRYSQPGWRLDPALSDAPRYLEIDPDVVPPPQILLSVSIDKSGRIGRIEPVNSQVPESTRRTFEQTRSWLFFPARVDGSPVQTDVNMLFRFHTAGSKDSKTWLSDYPAEPPNKLVVVDVFPYKPEQGKWLVQYGGTPASKILPER